MTMETNKRYDKALARARDFYEFCKKSGTKNTAEIILNIFPELKESEDERIRKMLIEFFSKGAENNSSTNGISDKDILAWLEKQGEQKETLCDKCRKEQPSHSCQDITELGRCALEKQGEQKPTDKFKVGDWGIDEEDGTIFQIVKVLNNTYTYRTNEGVEYSCTNYSLENVARHWTLVDARDGDVLYSIDSKQPFIYKERKPFEQATAYCGINKYGKFFVWKTKDCIITTDKYVPATKEQRDLLFQKMKEAGYKWDAEKKELKKIEQKLDIDSSNLRTMKQLTKEQAIAFAENKCYENMTYRQIAEFQMEQDKLCMPFGVFHEAMEKTLGRPVFTHEFAFREELRKELYGEKEPPTFEEICALIPKEKLMVIKL